MKILAPIAAALLLTGCVSASTTVLNDREALVSAGGSAFNQPGQVYRRALAESAKVTLERGYTHFVIVGDDDTSTVQTIHSGGYYAPVQAKSVSERDGDTTTTNTTFSGGYVPPSDAHFVHSGRQFSIKMFRADEAEAQHGAYDARVVLANSR